MFLMLIHISTCISFPIVCVNFLGWLNFNGVLIKFRPHRTFRVIIYRKEYILTNVSFEWCFKVSKKRLTIENVLVGCT